MLPSQLTPAHFSTYTLQAKQVAVEHLSLLRELPLGFLPSLLREIIDYDYKFPAERAQLDKELAYLVSLRPQQLTATFAAFSKLRLSPAQEADHWVDQPTYASEELSAYLWSTGQMDTFRVAATDYGNRLSAATPPMPPPMPRLGIAVIGQGAAFTKTTLFRKLRAHGTYFTHIEPKNGLQQLLAGVEARAQLDPSAYAHWYVDGGSPAEHSHNVTAVSYAMLAPVRDALLGRIQVEVGKPGMGPEQLRNYLARLSPPDLGMSGDPVLDHLKLKVMTEGSGTQILSTTFAQWTAREVLRRAAPVTLLVRFAPRQRQRPMNELLASSPGELELDPQGSLIDADMAAYYHWINQQRLSGAEQSSFVVWFEGHGQAIAISPMMPRGAESKSPLDLASLIRLSTG